MEDSNYKLNKTAMDLMNDKTEAKQAKLGEKIFGKLFKKMMKI